MRLVRGEHPGPAGARRRWRAARAALTGAAAVLDPRAGVQHAGRCCSRPASSRCARRPIRNGSWSSPTMARRARRRSSCFADTRASTRACASSGTRSIGDRGNRRARWNGRGASSSGCSTPTMSCCRTRCFALPRSSRTRPDVDVVYSDEDKLELDGARSDAYIKPDWSPDLFLSSMYICHFLVLRRAMVEAAGGFRSALRRLAGLRSDVARDGPDQSHCARARRLVPLAQDAGVGVEHRRGEAMGVPRRTARVAGLRGSQRARRERRGDDRVRVSTACAIGCARRRVVSVIVPVLSAADRAARCSWRASGMRAIRTSSSCSRDRAARTRCGREPRRAAAFGSSRERDAGPCPQCRRAGRRWYALLFTEPWLEPLGDDWIDALVEHAQRPGVGAVGGKTFYPDGRVRHIGLVDRRARAGRPGLRRLRRHVGRVFRERRRDPQCGAVSRACLMTRRALFEQVADSIRRWTRTGWRWTTRSGSRRKGCGWCAPRSHGRSSRWRHAAPPPPPRAEDVAHLRARWGTALDRDPYYNFHFVTGDPDYCIRAGSPGRV